MKEPNKTLGAPSSLFPITRLPRHLRRINPRHLESLWVERPGVGFFTEKLKSFIYLHRESFLIKR